MSSIEERYREIHGRLKRAGAGRDVRLIGVTKTVPVERISEAFAAGITIFGENRIQEALPKIRDMASLAAEWHFIGHLQTNKARDAVRYFSMIQSIDSGRLLEQVDKEANKAGKTIDVLLEINLGQEATKSGMPEGDLSAVLEMTRGLEHVRVHGLMTIPPYMEDPEEARPFFRRLRELRDKYRSAYPNLAELSMGMSHDFEVAVSEGATMVRIGAALFGER